MLVLEEYRKVYRDADVGGEFAIPYGYVITSLAFPRVIKQHNQADSLMLTVC